jgi:oligoendopeptidase F
MRRESNERTRLHLLMNYLDGIRGTLFRQTQFAEFELMIHEQAEGGVSLTGDGLTAQYLELTRRYYGHDAGACIVEDVIGSEWANIPHFYYNFYVFQYATSLIASAALSERVLEGDAETRERYLRLLSSGGSEYPIALLREAGVDMTTPEPFNLMVRKINRVMDEVEELAHHVNH